MNTRFWRHAGVMVLSVLFVFPLLVTAEGEGEAIKPDLTWYSPKDGIKRGPDEVANHAVTFTKPVAEVCKGDFKSAIDGEELVDGRLDPTTQVECAKDSEDKCIGFITKTKSKVSVRCYTKDKSSILSEDQLTDEGVYCLPENMSVIEQTWGKYFMADKQKKEGTEEDVDLTVDGKAHPWDGEKAYCPDPIIHFAAYNLMLNEKKEPVKSAQVGADLVSRSTLTACARVVDAYMEACAESLGAIGTKLGGIKKAKADTIKDSKMAMAALWIGGTNCNWDDSTTTCPIKWNWIKGYSAVDLALNGNGDALLKVPKKIEKETDLIQKILTQMQEESTKTNWKSGTLDVFLAKQAESGYDESDEEGGGFSTDIAANNTETEEAQRIYNFLQKKSLNIRMANALNATKTFQVTKWLRRDSNSKRPDEADLTLIGNESVDTNVLDKMIKLVTQVLGSLGVLLLIVSAVMMVVSQGEETMLQKAKQTFLYTLIGLLIAFFSYTIVRFVLEFLLLR